MDRKKEIKGFLAGILCTVMIGGAVFGVWYNFGQDEVLNTSTLKKAKQIEKLIDKNYLEEADSEKLETYIYKGLVAGLGDPYSGYYTQEEFQELTQSTDGEYKGIGVSLQQNVRTGEVTVTKCYEGSPGARAGILPGDVIQLVNGESTVDRELTEIVKSIKSSDNDSVSLEIIREGESQPLNLDVPLEEVEIPMVEYEMLEDNIGYIQINEFAEVTENQYLAAFEELSSKGMERMIVDLRGNPGGLLSSVCNILEHILPEGLIVYTEDKYGSRNEYMCSGENELKVPMAVLVNGSSASAAEIFSGAVQDYGIGKLVGTTTFGKGIVQSMIPLSEGDAVKLTISKYYTPKGRNIHETGLEPDVEVELNEELKQKVTIEKAEDNQLQKAIEVVKGL